MDCSRGSKGARGSEGLDILKVKTGRCMSIRERFTLLRIKNNEG